MLDVVVAEAARQRTREGDSQPRRDPTRGDGRRARPVGREDAARCQSEQVPVNQGPVGVSQGPLAPGMSAEHAKPPGVMRLQGSSTHRSSAIVSVAWVASKSVRRDRRLGIARR